MPRCQSRESRTDRSQSREYKLPPTLYFPVAIPATLRRPAQHRPQIDPARWPEIVERARHESLPALASEYDVSHETLRAIARRMAGKEPTAAAA